MICTVGRGWSDSEQILDSLESLTNPASNVTVWTKSFRSYWCVICRQITAVKVDWAEGLQPKTQEQKKGFRGDRTEGSWLNSFILLLLLLAATFTLQKPDHSCMQVRQSQAYNTCFSTEALKRGALEVTIFTSLEAFTSLKPSFIYLLPVFAVITEFEAGAQTGTAWL